MKIPYRLIRSERKTISLTINEALELVVRAPSRTPQPAIDRFVQSNTSWIQENTEKTKAYYQKHPPPDDSMISHLKHLAGDYIPGRVDHFSKVMGLMPAKVTITAARTRFGSCSSKDRLCFSCLVMRFPPEAIDCVVVHELAHIVHKNHGKAFYALVERVLPDYRERVKLLSV